MQYRVPLIQKIPNDPIPILSTNFTNTDTDNGHVIHTPSELAMSDHSIRKLDLFSANIVVTECLAKQIQQLLYKNNVQ